MLQPAQDYFRSLLPDEKKALCEKVGIKKTSFNNLLYSNKKPSVSLACKLERATGGRITRGQIRPDVDWSLLMGTGVTK